MNIRVERQTPVMALVTLTAIVVAACVRYAVSPFDNETVSASTLPPLAEWLSAVSGPYRVWSVAAAGVLTVAAGMIVGQTGSRFGLYPSQTFLSMPLFGFVACGIFISHDVLAASLATLLSAMALKYMCRGSLRERDLSAMLYAGLCIGSVVLLSAAGAVYVAGALLAVFVLSFSARELLVLFAAMVLPVALCCYAVWALGGEFATPLMQIREVLFSASGVAAFGSDAVCALLLCGVVGFTFVCSAVLFMANRFMVPLKSRGILIYNLVLSLLSLAMFALPSSTPADFGMAAVPMATIMPVLFIREGGRLPAIIYLLLAALFILHLLYY